MGHVSRALVQAAIPSSCGMFVHLEGAESRVTSIDLGGSGPRVDSFLRKSVMSPS